MWTYKVTVSLHNFTSVILIGHVTALLLLSPMHIVKACIHLLARIDTNKFGEFMLDKAKQKMNVYRESHPNSGEIANVTGRV